MTTLGYDSTGSALVTPLSDGQLCASKYRLTAPGTLSSLHGRFTLASGSGTARLVCYAADGTSGSPGTLIAYSPTPITLAAGPAVLDVSSDIVDVDVGVGDYWIGWTFHGAAVGHAYGELAGATYAARSGVSDPPPDPFGPATESGTRKHSMWAVVDPPEGDAGTIKFGTGLAVTEEGPAVIRVDATLALIADVTIDALDSGGSPTGEPDYFDILDIPGAYSDLVGVLSVHVPSADPVSGVEWTFNNETALFNHYWRQTMNPDFWSARSISAEDYDNAFPILTAGGDAGTLFSQHSFLIPGYSSATWDKTFLCDSVILDTETDGRPVFFNHRGIGWWANTDPVDRITITGPMTDGSRLRLYGRT